MDRSDYYDRESLVWVMLVGYSNLSVEKRAKYLDFVMLLWSERFPEDIRGGCPEPEERTRQPKHAELPSLDVSSEWIIDYLEKSRENARNEAKAIEALMSPSFRNEQYNRLKETIEDCFQQAIKVARGCLKFVEPEHCLEELHTAVQLWDIHHRLPLNMFSSSLASILPPPYAHLRSTPRSSIYSMNWNYPWRGFDMEKFDETVLEVEECISETKAFLEYYRHEIPSYLVCKSFDHQLDDESDHESPNIITIDQFLPVAVVHEEVLLNSTGRDDTSESELSSIEAALLDAELSTIEADLLNYSDSDEDLNYGYPSSPVLSSNDITIVAPCGEVDAFLSDDDEGITTEFEESLTETEDIIIPYAGKLALNMLPY